jgi:hypothetical protein
MADIIKETKLNLEDSGIRVELESANTLEEVTIWDMEDEQRIIFSERLDKVEHIYDVLGRILNEHKRISAAHTKEQVVTGLIGEIA